MSRTTAVGHLGLGINQEGIGTGSSNLVAILDTSSRDVSADKNAVTRGEVDAGGILSRSVGQANEK